MGTQVGASSGLVASSVVPTFGRAALSLDQEARRHGFRRTAAQVLTQANPADRDLLSAYTAGVNAGLAALAQTPWEYLALRLTPQPWREEDSVLCIYAMWFDLQDHKGSFELNREALRRTLGQGHLQLFDEQTFATHFAEAAVQNLIALCGHAQELYGVSARLQNSLNMLCLPHGQAAFTRGNDNGTFGGRDVLRVQTSNLFVIFQANQMLA